MTNYARANKKIVTERIDRRRVVSERNAKLFLESARKEVRMKVRPERMVGGSVSKAKKERSNIISMPFDRFMEEIGSLTDGCYVREE